MADNMTSHKEAQHSGDTPERVSQPLPAEFTELSEIVGAINLVGEIAETIEKHHEQIAGRPMKSAAKKDDEIMNEREKLIAQLPEVKMMQEKLEKNINDEIRSLRKQARKISSRKIGWAYELNELFARIRRLSAMLRQILHASAEVIRKYYIAVFIDRQSLAKSPRSVQPV